MTDTTFPDWEMANRLYWKLGRFPCVLVQKDHAMTTHTSDAYSKFRTGFDALATALKHLRDFTPDDIRALSEDELYSVSQQLTEMHAALNGYNNRAGARVPGFVEWLSNTMQATRSERFVRQPYEDM